MKKSIQLTVGFEIARRFIEENIKIMIYLCTIYYKLNVTPMNVKWSEKLHLTAALCSEI